MERAHSNPTSPSPQYKLESSRPQSTSEMESDEGQRITKEFLKIAKEHEKKKRIEQSVNDKVETEAVYEQIRGDTPPTKEESLKDITELETTGLMTTVIPTTQLGEGALRTAIERQNEEWKVNETSPIKDRTFIDYEATMSKTFDRKPLDKVDREAQLWPPPMVYGITPNGSPKEGVDAETIKLHPSRKKPQTPKIPESTTGIQGDEVKVVTPKRHIEGDTRRAPFSMDFLLQDEEKDLKDVVVQETAYSIRGNAAVIVKTKSWLNKYGTKQFGVDLITGDIYAIKNGSWDKIPEIAKIDKEQHSIIMSTTPMGRQSLSTSTLPTTPENIQPPKATSTGPPLNPYTLTKSAERRRDKEKHVSFLSRDLLDEVLKEESLGIIEELRKAEKAREQAEKEAQELEEERKRLEQAKIESEKELEKLRYEQELQRQMALEEERRKLEQQLQTAELKRQAAEKERERKEQEKLEQEIINAKLKAEHMDREFRERLSSADSIQFYSGTEGQLTEKEMLDLLILRNKLEAKLRKMDLAHQALEAASLELDPSTVFRHKRVRERVVEDMQKVEHFLNSMKGIVDVSEEEIEGAVGGKPLENQEEQPSQV